MPTPQPLPEEPDSAEVSPYETAGEILPETELDPDPDPREAGAGRRAVIALAAYAALAALAALRLDGRPRLVVWLFLGLFAVKTLLVVLKQRAS